MKAIERVIKFWRANDPNWVVIILIANLAFYAVSLFASNPQHQNGSIDPSHESLYLLGTSSFHLVVQGQWHRLIVANYFHVGLIHLGVNCLALWQLGPMTQVILGSRRFLTLYILTGITGTVASITWHFYSSDFREPWQIVGGVGASTSLFGVFGFLLFWAKKTPGADGFARQLVFWLFVNVAISFRFPMIDNAGHAGGFVGGLLIGYCVLSRRPTRWGKVLMHKTTTVVLGVTTLICFAFVPITYFGEFGTVCRTLYKARPNVLVTVSDDNLDVRTLEESADEVRELKESLPSDFPVNLAGLESQIRLEASQKKQNSLRGFRSPVADGYIEFVSEYCRYLGVTSMLTYRRP